QRPVRRWATPNHVAPRRIRSRNSPHLLPEVWKPFSKRDTESSVRFRGCARVLEVILPHAAPPAKIKPGMTVLVNEQWRRRVGGSADEPQPLELHPWPSPCVPTV